MTELVHIPYSGPRPPDTHPYADLPIAWAFGDDPGDGCNGPPVYDPLVFDVHLDNSGDEAIFRGSLRELVEYSLDFKSGTFIHPDSAQAAASLRDALRSLAEYINSKIPKEESDD
jgi:hypothetical protein